MIVQRGGIPWQKVEISERGTSKRKHKKRSSKNDRISEQRKINCHWLEFTGIVMIPV